MQERIAICSKRSQPATASRTAALRRRLQQLNLTISAIIDPKKCGGVAIQFNVSNICNISYETKIDEVKRFLYLQQQEWVAAEEATL